MSTRKSMRGGLFGFGSSPVNTKANTLKAQRNYNLKHSKSRVANILSAPGQVRYTNKERIEAGYQKALEELKKIEQPTETANALRMIAGSVEDALKSQKAREAGAVVITIPIGVAQLFYKAMYPFIALLMALSDLTLQTGFWSVNSGQKFNANFNTTRNVYARARKFTGANTS